MRHAAGEEGGHQELLRDIRQFAGGAMRNPGRTISRHMAMARLKFRKVTPAAELWGGERLGCMRAERFFTNSSDRKRTRVTAMETRSLGR